MKFPSPGLVVFGSVAHEAIYAIFFFFFFGDRGFLQNPDIQTVSVPSFQLPSGFWLLAGPVFQNQGTVSRTQTAHSNTFILI